MIDRGEKLVILDDLILDVESYAWFHPGGRFLLEHNIGRDISKFFYGGYSLENSSGLKSYAHSNIAKRVVNSLIIGRLIDNAPFSRMKVYESYKVNQDTKVFVLKSNKQVKGLKLYHKKLEAIGRHYLICNDIYPSVKRHYTITNCMKKDIYFEYIRIMKDVLEKGKTTSIPKNLLDDKNS
jgi:hypothetical protein